MNFSILFSGPMIFMKRFPYKDIKRATDGFHRIMYTNSHIVVYKARFQDGGVALVKEIRDYSQAEHVFYREMQLLGRLHHRHLLALRGFSIGNKRFGAHLFPLFHFFLISTCPPYKQAPSRKSKKYVFFYDLDIQ